MKPIVVALLGNPNCGKTTLFNTLTGGHQRVGNWPGVTVDKKRGSCRTAKVPLEFVDLPGCVDLPDNVFKNIFKVDSIELDDLPIDELITHEYLATHDASVIVNVVDATQLERHLYLTLQLLECSLESTISSKEPVRLKRNTPIRRNIPIIIALNMMDAAKKLGIELDVQALSKILGCPVIPIVATQRETTQGLKTAILEQVQHEQFKLPVANLDCKVSAIIENNEVSENSEVNEKNEVNKKNEVNENSAISDNSAVSEKMELNEYNEVRCAQERYQKIQEIIKAVIKETKKDKNRKLIFSSLATENMDRIILHRYLGIPIFLALMYLVFVFTIQVGGSLQDIFDEVLETVCITWMHKGFNALNAPEWLITIMTNGIGVGLMTTLSFIPIIASMFFCLSILESSGYMARAAFVMDKTMQWLGLGGKSFVPMILGFGCNVPAILGTRTLDNYRERILTIMMSPFMSCGARLAIFALFVSAFFKDSGHNIIFALYLIGILLALLTGLALRSVIIGGHKASLIMELPPYRTPSLKRICQTTWFRLKRFLLKAGVIIVPLCVLFSFLSGFKTEAQEPWLTYIGRAATPLFEPMGVEKDNWPATVGLMTGILAKEVVVGTLESLYINNNINNSTAIPSSSTSSKSDMQATVNQSSAIQSSTSDTSGTLDTSDSTILPILAERFGGTANAFAYLLFVLLYFPCVSVLAAIARELNMRWALFSAVWTTGIAYSVAVLFYQSASFLRHPQSSLFWIVGMIFAMTIGLWSMRKWVQFNMRKQKIRIQKPLPTQILILNT